MKPREVPITRAHVVQWLQGYNGPLEDVPQLRNRLKHHSRLGDLADVLVENTGNDSLPPTIKLIDLLMLDIKSYA